MRSWKRKVAWSLYLYGNEKAERKESFRHVDIESL